MFTVFHIRNTCKLIDGVLMRIVAKSDWVLQGLWYNQRGPLEYPFFRPFPRLVLGCMNADFCVQGRIFQRFSSSTCFPLHHSRFLWFFRAFAPFLAKIRYDFCWFCQETADFAIFRQNLADFFRNFAEFQWFRREWCQDSQISEKSDKLIRKFAEFWCKIAENLPEKNGSSKSLRW